MTAALVRLFCLALTVGFVLVTYRDHGTLLAGVMLFGCLVTWVLFVEMILWLGTDEAKERFGDE